MKRSAQLLVFLLMFSITAFAIEDKSKGFASKLFFQIGGTVATDVMNMNGIFCKDINAENIPEKEFSVLNMNFITVTGVARVNWMEFTNNTSLSLALRPTLSYGRTIGNFKNNTSSFRFPVTLDFNYGTAATVATRAKTGFSIGGGIEYIAFPLGNAIDVLLEGLGSTRKINMKGAWWQPVMGVGVKFMGKHYYCREINIKVAGAGFLSEKTLHNKQNIDEGLYGKISNWQAYGITITYLQYLNY